MIINQPNIERLVWLLRVQSHQTISLLIKPYFLSQALELDASNEKALFRRGEALCGMKEFDRAKSDFQQVVQLYPANKAAKSQVLCYVPKVIVINVF